jgi:hypothetical protein
MKKFDSLFVWCAGAQFKLRGMAKDGMMQTAVSGMRVTVYGEVLATLDNAAQTCVSRCAASLLICRSQNGL